MKFSQLLLILSVVASAIYLLASPFAASDWPVVLKVVSILLLAVLGFRVNGWLGTALTICALGDFLLGVRRLGGMNVEQLFLFGLGTFLVGQLVYIAMFRKCRTQGWWNPGPLRTLGIAVILVALGSVLGILRNSLAPLLILVVAYSVVLAGMAVSAMLARLGNPWAAIGALFFVASDAMLAISKFHGPFPGKGPLIWITYYLAQLLIFLGVERQTGKPPCPPTNTSSGIEQP
jgi:uncharacterized membrane protein YhhN